MLENCLLLCFHMFCQNISAAYRPNEYMEKSKNLSMIDDDEEGLKSTILCLAFFFIKKIKIINVCG